MKKLKDYVKHVLKPITRSDVKWCVQAKLITTTEISGAVLIRLQCFLHSPVLAAVLILCAFVSGDSRQDLIRKDGAGKRIGRSYFDSLHYWIFSINIEQTLKAKYHKLELCIILGSIKEFGFLILKASIYEQGCV